MNIDQLACMRSLQEYLDQSVFPPPPSLGLVDFHTHIIPNVDDGSKGMAISAYQLLKLVLIGSRPTVISGMLMLFCSRMQRNSCDELIHY